MAARVRLAVSVPVRQLWLEGALLEDWTMRMVM